MMTESKELISWEIFHTLSLDEKSNSATFFDRTMNSENITNMELAAQIPDGKQFFIDRIVLSAPIDFFLKSLPRVELVIASKIYLFAEMYSHIEQRKDINMRLFSIFCKPDFFWNSIFQVDRNLCLINGLNFRARLEYVKPEHRTRVSLKLSGKMQRPIQ